MTEPEAITFVEEALDLDGSNADCSMDRAILALYHANAALKTEIAALRKLVVAKDAVLQDIHVTAHCLAKAGPLAIPTLDAAWVKLMDLGIMAARGLAAGTKREKGLDSGPAAGVE